MSRLTDITGDELILIRWRDIVHLKEGIHAADENAFDSISPVLEFTGRLIEVKRGIAAFQTEWDVFRHEGYDMGGTAGHETQLVPIGCIESIHELKVGKCLYTRERGKKNGKRGSRSGGPESTEPVPSEG